MDRVLFLGSNPDNTTRLRLDREYREVDQHLREGGQRDELDLRSAWAVRLTDLSRELLRWEPTVVHFSGHGTPDGLVFEAEDGSSVVAPIEPLAELFRVLKDNIRCVVLNACHAESQAKVLSEHIEFVVGTSASITDPGAIAFASGFYRGLSFGCDWCTSLDLGRAQVSLLGLPDSDIIHSYPACP